MAGSPAAGRGPGAGRSTWGFHNARRPRGFGREEGVEAKREELGKGRGKG